METDDNKTTSQKLKNGVGNCAKVLFWIFVSPKKFYNRLMQFVFRLKPGISQLLTAISFIFPALFGVSLFNLTAQMAFFTISDRILALDLQVLIYIGLGIFISLLYSLVLPGVIFQHKFRKTHPTHKKLIRSFHWSWVLRRNIVFFPLNLIFWIASINLSQEIWSLYALGFFIEIILWLSFIWSLIYLWAALNSIEIDFTVTEISCTLFPNCPKKFGKTLAFSGIFIFFYLGLLIGLSFWLGAPFMPLGFKIAVILLHGQ